MRRQKKTFQQRVVLYGRALPLMLFLLLGSWVVSLYVEPSVPAGGGFFHSGHARGAGEKLLLPEMVSATSRRIAVRSSIGSG